MVQEPDQDRVLDFKTGVKPKRTLNVGDQETKECPFCEQTPEQKSMMIRYQTGRVRASLPPQYQEEWRCIAGHTEDAGWVTPESSATVLRRRLEELNAQQE